MIYFRAFDGVIAGGGGNKDVYIDMEQQWATGVLYVVDSCFCNQSDPVGNIGMILHMEREVVASLMGGRKKG